jgi:hypothetical protein
MFLLPVVIVLILNVEMIMTLVTLLIPFVAAVAVVVAGPVGAVSRDNDYESQNIIYIVFSIFYYCHKICKDG